MLGTDPNLRPRYQYISHHWYFFVFTFLHKNNSEKRKCILWRYKFISYLINIHSLKRCLQKFKVVNILMLQLRLKFYFLQTNAAWKEHVHELAIGRSWKETRKVLEWALLSPEVPPRAASRKEVPPHRALLATCVPLLAPVPPHPIPQVWAWRKGLCLRAAPAAALSLSTVGWPQRSPQSPQTPRTTNTTPYVSVKETGVKTTLLSFCQKKRNRFFLSSSSKLSKYINVRQK